jgi:murein DD-endopeptidase MepM/ murein hydrolase activator NlpD
MKVFYWPLEENLVSQYYGENKACIDIATGTKVITCNGKTPPEGYKSIYSQMKGHQALDLRALRWTPVYAAREGVVYALDRNHYSGLDVTIFHDLGVEGCWRTNYEHLMSIEVEPGQKVYTGQLIGYSGDTGYAAGPHLHFEVMRVNKENTQILNFDNGFFGRIDPLPLMYSDCAKDVNTLRKTIETAAALLQAWIDRMRAIRTSA